MKLNDEFQDRLKINWRFEFRIDLSRIRLFPTLVLRIKWLGSRFFKFLRKIALIEIVIFRKISKVIYRVKFPTGESVKNSWFSLKNEKGDGCSWAGFLKSLGKIQATDSNDSLRYVEYDAKRIFVRRCMNWSQVDRLKFSIFLKIRNHILFWKFKYINNIINICKLNYKNFYGSFYYWKRKKSVIMIIIRI